MDILFFAKNLSVWDGYVYRFTGRVNDGSTAEKSIIDNLVNIKGHGRFINRIVEINGAHYVYLKDSLPDGIAAFYPIGDIGAALAALSEQQLAQNTPQQEPAAEEPVEEPAEEPPTQETPGDDNAV